MPDDLPNIYTIASVYHVCKFLLSSTAAGKNVADWLVPLPPGALILINQCMLSRWRYLVSSIHKSTDRIEHIRLIVEDPTQNPALYVSCFTVRTCTNGNYCLGDRTNNINKR